MIFSTRALPCGQLNESTGARQSTRSASLSRHVRQADRQVHRDDCGILRKVQKVLEGHHVEAEFARIEIFEHGAPFALEAICAAKPDHLAPTAKIFAAGERRFFGGGGKVGLP
jgi:hypothetical protein